MAEANKRTTKKNPSAANWQQAKSKIKEKDSDATATGSKEDEKKVLKEEMANVGVIEKPEFDPEFAKKFESTQTAKHTNYELVACVGRSFTGKTRLMCSSARVVAERDTLKYDLVDKDVDIMLALLDKKVLLPPTPIYVIGTEESTADELFGRTSAPYYSNFDIKYLEVAKYDGATYDFIGTYNNFLKAIAYFIGKGDIGGTLVIDSMSTIYSALNYILRTKVMKIPALAKEQGVPSRYWFWRNQQMESIMLALRRIKMHKFTSYKMSKGHKENDDEEPEFKIRWVEESNYHLSNTRIDMDLAKQSKENTYSSTFDKCRNKPSLFHTTNYNMNANKMFLEIYK
jgi:hypothetical protein